jgi:hypothetical protein
MTSSLLPERPLLISPTLASTIGLEEAVMLHVLAELISHGATVKRNRAKQLAWLELDDGKLQQAFPFWAPIDIKRVQSSLQSLGLVLIDADTTSPGSYFFAIDDVDSADIESAGTSSANIESVAKTPTQQPVTAVPGSATASLMPPNWQPDDNWMRQCKQQGIPQEFAQSLVPEFVAYWRDRAQARFSWGSAFSKHALKRWREEQTRKGAYELTSVMGTDWQPNSDAVGILEIAGVNPSFIEDAIPEFVLYWRERGMVNGAWNTKFIEHIRRQWAKFSASLAFDDTPRPITADWQPSADFYEILQLAEIEADYARRKLPEFVMYWKDSQQAKPSWNTAFLQFIKQDWARQLKVEELDDAKDRIITGSTQEKVRERLRQLADRSWAD